MKIKGIEFDFNPMNATHLERIADASEAYDARDKEIQATSDETLRGKIAAVRASCQNVITFIDAVLGEDASKKLKLDPEDLSNCLENLRLVTQTMIAEKKAADAAEKK